MKSRCQASLEYLLTYGWALILVATAIGILVFILSPPSGRLSCTVDQPTRFLVKGAFLPYDEARSDLAAGEVIWSPGKIILQNITGTQISVKSFTYYIGDPSNYEEYQTPDEYLYATWNGDKCYYYMTFDEVNGKDIYEVNEFPVVVEPGGEIVLDKFLFMYGSDKSASCPFSYSGMMSRRSEFVRIGVSYRDRFGLERQATISCKNLPEPDAWPLP